MSIRIPQKPLLVAGATGAIGKEVVRYLLEYNAPVRVFVRSPEKVAALPGHVERIVGDLKDPDAVKRALQGVHAAFFVSPHDDAEEEIADTFLGACRREAIRLVFAGVYYGGSSRIVRFIRHSIFKLLMPHYAPKLRIGARIADYPDSVILDTVNYYQNDEMCREHILDGRYPFPFRLGPRVDTRDVGEAAARALLDSEIPAGSYALVGPEALSGDQIAANWSAAVGREVRHEPDIQLTEQLLDEHFGGRKAVDFQKTYRLISKYAIKLKPVQVQETSFLLGRPPRKHVDYAREVAAQWEVETGLKSDAGLSTDHRF